MRITARVPATCANLGPGFDSFGLALDLVNEVTVDTEREPGVEWEGEGSDELPTDGEDLVSRAIVYTVDQQRQRPGAIAVPPFHLHGLNRIPMERGLGSSAAAAVAGVAIADALLADAQTDAASRDPYPIFGYAAELEGHPDNAAAATYGGFTIAVAGSVHRLRPHPDLFPVVLVPRHLRMTTTSARAALADEVARGDAVFNLGHASLLTIALTQDPGLLDVALHDRLHEDARLAAAPEARDLLVDLRQVRRVPACVSGAGPALLAFPPGGRDIGALPEGWRAIRVNVRTEGVTVGVET